MVGQRGHRRRDGVAQVDEGGGRQRVEKSQQLQRRIEQLAAMQQVLQDMARRCHGDEGPECAILEDLAAPQEDSV